MVSLLQYRMITQDVVISLVVSLRKAERAEYDGADSQWNII